MDTPMIAVPTAELERLKKENDMLKILIEVAEIKLWRERLRASECKLKKEEEEEQDPLEELDLR